MIQRTRGAGARAAITVAAIALVVVLILSTARSVLEGGPSAPPAGAAAVKAEEAVNAAEGVNSAAAADVGGTMDGSPTAAEYTAVDPDVVRQLEAAGSPEATVDVVIVADEATRSDPGFLSVARGLVALGDGLYAGPIGAADAESLAEFSGLKVSLDQPVVIDPAEDDAQVAPSESGVLRRHDPNAAVSDVDPALVGVRETLGVNGGGQVIAIIDSGIDTSALGLAGKVTHREDFSTPSTTCTDNGFLDPDGHGTGVASIAGGAPNSVDPALEGVAPGVAFVDLRIFNCSGNATSTQIAQALAWVSTNHEAWNISAVNMSLGLVGGILDGTDALSIQANRLVADGVFVAVAAGNAGDQPSTIRSPGTAHYVTTVGAAGVTAYGAYFASYSSQGPVGSRPGVDFLAAGDSIRFAQTTRWSYAATTINSGTSMASPYVAGLAALLLQQDDSRTPSGTACELGASCPEGVEASSMVNPVEDSIKASDWFEPGIDTRSGAGLVSASDSLLGAARAAAPHLELALDTASPMMIEIPPHDAAIGFSIVTDAPIATSALSVNRLEYALLDATGWPMTVDIPCHVAQAGYTLECVATTYEPWNQRVWYLSSPATEETTWLRLRSARAVNASITAPGFPGVLAMRSGVVAEDVALDSSGDATVTLRRTATSAIATAFAVEPSDGLVAPASVTLPAGGPGTAVDFVVSKDPAVTPVSPDNGGRLALRDGASLALAVSVTYPPLSDLAGQVTVGGVPISSGTLFTRLPKITSNGTIVGNSKHPALASGTAPSQLVETPYVVEPGSNEAVRVDIPQTSISDIELWGVSGDGERLLLKEAAPGSGAVPDDTDSRVVFFVHDRETNSNVEIGSSMTSPAAFVGAWPVISDDGLSAAFVADLAGGGQGLYWQGGSDFGTRTLVSTFASSERVSVRGVLADSIVVEFGSVGRIYSVGDGTFNEFGEVWTLSTSLSQDGSAISYSVLYPGAVRCYRVADAKTFDYNLRSQFVMEAFVAGNDCAYVAGPLERGDPPYVGEFGEEFVRLYPDGTRDTLAVTTDSAHFWRYDRTGTQMVTSTGVSVGAGDTNGLVDLYRGALSSTPLVATPIPIVSGSAEVGQTLTVATGTWEPAGVGLTFQWNRDGTPISGATHATYVPPAGDIGAEVSVTVTGRRTGFIPASVTSDPTAAVVSAPVIDGVSPASGPLSGGTTVTLTGVAFTGVTAVTFDGVTATGLDVRSDSEMIVITPAHSAGTVDVVGTNGIGDGPAASFTYVAPPAVSNVSPLSGPVAGGTVVTLTGSAFTGATSVTFGGVAGTALSVGSATSLTVTSPAHAVGPVNVVVTTPYGSSSAATFTYRAIPVVVSVSPGFGPTTGGTTVTVTGSGFTDASQVTFGGVAGTGLSVGSDTSLTVTSPAGGLVRAPIVVTNPLGASVAAAAAFFAYTDGAVVAGIPEVIADVAGFTPNVVRCYQVTGKAGVPVGAVGVVLNVTASLPNAPGHVRVYPDYLNNGASPAPAVSTVNFEVARDVANSTTISLPTGGKVCAYGVGGTLARLILDVDGYILPGSGITLVTPEKLVDTRPQAWYHAGTINGPVQPMTDYEVQVGGVGSVPSDAVAVIANITVVDTRSPGHLRMWASDTAMPNTSVVNYAPETKANSQIVALSADGKLTFRSFSYVPTSVSPVQVLIDVTGYIAAGSDFVATVPTKLVETRSAYGIVGPITGPLSPGVIYPVPVDTSVVPAGATAVILNVTAVQPTAFGHIRVYPDTNGLGTTPPPVMSNLNFIPGRDIPNMVIVQLPPDRKIDLYTVFSGGGRTDLVVNIIGYIAAPNP